MTGEITVFVMNLYSHLTNVSNFMTVSYSEISWLSIWPSAVLMQFWLGGLQN